METLPLVWNRATDPRLHPGYATRQPKPVTWDDLDGRMQTAALRGFPTHRTGAGHGPDDFQLVNIEATLDLYTRAYAFGRVIWPFWNNLFTANWRELADALAERGLYLFDIWGYCPQGVEDARAWSEYRVPDEMHRYLLQRLGNRYLGWDNGEQDGRYVGGFARRLCPAPSTRAEAYRGFSAYMDRLAGDLQHHLVALNSLTLTHYLAERADHRLLGLETAQGLPSVPMWFSFLRGACKQYGLLWFGNASVWNRWGAHAPDAPPEDPEGGAAWTGPNSGTSLELLRQLWYLEVMYGSCIMSIESGHISGTRTSTRTVDGHSRVVPALTPIGELQLQGTRWCEAHPDRGVQHTPLALLWDHDTGWLPPRHLYSSDPFLVWGNLAYSEGDHQIDLMLRELFPGYEDGSFFHDETGFITPTPCGDIADVLLSDVDPSILDRYRCVLVLGETRLEGSLFSRLRAFVSHGGTVVACANQCSPEALQFFGAADAGADLRLHHAFVGQHPSSWREPPYVARALRVEQGEVLARTGPPAEGLPLAIRRPFPGGGCTLLFAATFGMSEPLCQPEDIRSREDEPLGSPHRMLAHVRALLLPVLRDLNLVEVVGAPIHHATNVTDSADRVLVTLCNPTGQAWRGAVGFRAAALRRARLWLPEDSAALTTTERWAWLDLEPRGVAIVELVADGPVMRFPTEGGERS